MFAQLDTKTVYTFMDSLITIPSYLKKAKELGYSHIGIMDKDNLYSAYHFIKAAQKEGMKPILGVEMDLIYQDRSITFQFIALNTKGYQNLLKLSTEKMTGQKIWESLTEFLGDLAIVIPYFSGIEEIRLPKDCYIGLRSDSPKLAYDRPTIPIHTVRYYSNDDRESLQVLRAIRDNVQLKDIGSVPKDQVLYASATMEEIFRARFPESLLQLEQLVSTIEYEFDTNLKLPRFNREKEAVIELRERSEEGLKTKGLWNSVYQTRLNQELDVIHQMGFDDYFLIVWDLLRFGRSRGYYMGMGRGSAAGSLVSYALDITGIDPVKNHLLFERFLNVERYSMPDIDIDLPDIYRSEFLHYVRDRYGSHHTAQIVTFSTFGAKQVIRDVFKRFGATEYELTQLTKKISFKDTLASAYEKNISFRQLIHSKTEYQRAFEIAKKIEGQPRQSSIHAAGIVMSDDNLTNHIPLKAGEEMFITQYDANAVESNGLLKMDFLGLRNLTFLQKMQEALVEETGRDFSIRDIPLEDAATLRLFASGQTKGIFQFEQAGAIHLLKRIQPSKFEEVVATTSLNRPGASDYTDNFVNRKYGKEKVDLIDPLVAPILASTYGIMLYQEQVMQIAQVYAGFTLGKADLLRRAMSKKNIKDMEDMKQEFISGAKALGRDLGVAEHLFSMMAKFAGYGFNRSHAYAYSALAFQLAYFKTHYPHIFYAVMLNYSSSEYLNDALERGFSLSSISINTIPFHDKIQKEKITLGLRHLKAVPKEMSYWIIENRPFKSIEDFLMRLPENYQKLEILETMAKVGLFDDFEKNRKKILLNLDHLLIFVNELGSLFADSSYHWLESEDFNSVEKYQFEQEILGIGLSPHPLQEAMRTSVHPFSRIVNLSIGQQATILVQLERIKLIRTKTKGQQMAFLTVSDTQKKLDVTVFPEQYHHLKEQLNEGNLYYMIGRIQERDGRLQMVLNQLELVVMEKFWIQMVNHDKDQEVAAILARYPGNIPVLIHYSDRKETIRSQHFLVQKSENLEKELSTIVMKTVFR